MYLFYEWLQDKFQNRGQYSNLVGVAKTLPLYFKDFW